LLNIPKNKENTPAGSTSSKGHTVRVKLIKTLKVDSVEWCKFTAVMYEIGFCGDEQ